MRIAKLAIAAVTVAALGATPGPSSAAVATEPAQAVQSVTRQFEGTIVSVNRGARTFRLRDSERGTATIRVTGRTRFQRVGGFAGLRAGQTRIEAVVRRSGGAWVASSVERSGGGGRHGGGSDDD